MISQEIPNLLGGVSELPDEYRAANEFEVLENVWPHKSRGLRKRPGTTHIAQLAAAPGVGYVDGFWHHINRSPTDRKVLVVKTDGTVQVFDATTGGAQTVTAPNGTAYLSGATDGLRAVTVGDSTFLLNRSKLVKKGTRKATTQAFEALVFVRQADFSTNYEVDLDGNGVSFLTVDQGHASARVEIGTNVIAEGLKAALVAHEQINTDYNITSYGSTLHIARKDGKDFTIVGRDGLADGGLKVVKGKVQAVADLPARAKDGMIVEVVGDAGTAADNFWVVYDDADQPGESGVWRETAAPGSLLDLDATTMPMALVRNGLLTGVKTHGATPALPEIGPSTPTVYEEGFVLDSAAVAYSGAEDINLSEHNTYAQTGNFANCTGIADQSLQVCFDVDATAMRVSESVGVEVYISQDAGGSWSLLTSDTFYGGFAKRNLTLTTVSTVLTNALTRVRVKLNYGTAFSPGDYRMAVVTLHGTSHAENPGVSHWRRASTDVAFTAAELYPPGTAVALTCETVNTFTHTVPAGADQTGTQVASALQALVDAHATYVATLSGSTISITKATDTLSVSATVTMPSLTFWDSTLALVSGAHVGATVKNLTDGSTGTITANNATTITVGALTGGANNSIASGDKFAISSSGYVLDYVAWEERAAGDLEVCPFPSFVGSTINDIFFYKNRLGFLSGERVILSASGDLFRLSRFSAAQLLPDDAIDVTSAHAEVAAFDSAVPWEGQLVIFSDTGRQFSLRGDPVLTPSSVQLDRLGSFPIGSSACRPVGLGTRLVGVQFSGSSSGKGSVFELSNTENGVHGEDLAKHVPSLLTHSGTKKAQMVADDGLGLIAVSPSNAPNLFVYCYQFDTDGNRAQKAWATWILGTSASRILSLSLVEGVITLVITRDNAVYLETIDLVNLVAPDGDHRDRRGSANESTPTLRIRFSRIEYRDMRTDTVKDVGPLQLKSMELRSHDTKQFTVSVTAGSRAAKTTAVVQVSPWKGKTRIPLVANNRDLTIEITDTSPYGCAFSTMKWEGTISPRSRAL